MEDVLGRLRRDARQIWQAALAAVDSRQAVRGCLNLEGDFLRVGRQLTRLQPDSRIWLLGAGKASASMAQAAAEILAPRIAGGLIVVKYGHAAGIDLTSHGISIAEADHPLPDAQGLAATRRMLEELIPRSDPEDCVVVLLSGGGSALLEFPAPGLSLEDLIEVNRALLACGASIQEFNCLRKHLSGIKGGLLARHLGNRVTWTVILSDVPGDRLDTIASGPTVPDATTYADAWAVVERFRLEEQLPKAVLRHLGKGLSGEAPETPKAGDPCFERQHQIIIGSNSIACQAAAQAARKLGYTVDLETRTIVGDHLELAMELMQAAQQASDRLKPGDPPWCRISGGEPTVRLRGKGLGGRNQDLVLNCVRPLSALATPALLVSLGTDGTDGPTDAAGTMADNFSLSRHLALSSNPLESFIQENDAYPFFNALGDLIRTGPTGTNVMDLHLLLLAPADSGSTR